MIKGVLILLTYYLITTFELVKNIKKTDWYGNNLTF